MGSPIYKGHRSHGDAACVALARMAGAVILGKTVTAEFAGMSPGPTANPHNPAHTPGGSSSGSAAAVADFMVPVAYGTQTGGSVLRPGVVLRLRRLQADLQPDQPPGHLLRGRDARHHRAPHAHGRRRRAGHGRAGQQAAGVSCGSTLRRGSASAARRCGTLPTTPTKHAVEDAAKRLAAAGASVKEIVLPEEFEKLYYTARETINNYERSKSMAADWQHQPDKISKVLGDRVKQGLRDEARGLHRGAAARRPLPRAHRRRL